MLGTLKEGNSEYIGSFLNDQKHGKGLLATPEFKYEGEFKDDEFDGFG